MKEESRELRELREHLSSLPPGPVVDRLTVEKMLAACWTQFEGCGQSGMHAGKLGRAELMEWNPPRLAFTIERHGGTVMGSVYAEMQKWVVNLHDRTADVNQQMGRRLVGERKKPLKVGPLADEIARRILGGERCPELSWISESRVRLVMAMIIPSTNLQTTTSRRRRFRESLREILSQHGWRMKAMNTFEKT